MSPYIFVYMILFIDYTNKRCFIMAPKCGNTTIAEYLGVDIHTYYEDMEVIRVLQSDEFKKIIIIRNIAVTM